MAKIIDPFVAAEAAKMENIEYPQVAPNSRTQTLNQMGTMRIDLGDVVNRKFFEICSQSTNLEILEIGPAYGYTCLEAIQKSSANIRKYWALDMDENHLKILAKSAKILRETFLDSLTLIKGSFPDCDVLELIDSQKFDVILARHVFHFMTDQQIKMAFRQCFNLLKPGGYFLAIIMTPYLSITKPEVIKKFDQDVAEFLHLIETKPYNIDDRLKLPGFFEHVRETLDEKKFLEKGVDFDKVSITTGHMLKVQKDVVKFLLDLAGFDKIDYLEYVTLDSEVWQLDGRETVAVIARKM